MKALYSIVTTAPVVPYLSGRVVSTLTYLYYGMVKFFHKLLVQVVTGLVDSNGCILRNTYVGITYQTDDKSNAIPYLDT